MDRQSVPIKQLPLLLRHFARCHQSAPVEAPDTEFNLIQTYQTHQYSTGVSLDFDDVQAQPQFSPQVELTIGAGSVSRPENTFGNSPISTENFYIGPKGRPRKRFPCHLCAATFARKANLRKHIQVIHGIKQYDCHLCQSKFVLPSQQSAPSKGPRGILFCHIQTFWRFRTDHDYSAEWNWMRVWAHKDWGWLEAFYFSRSGRNKSYFCLQLKLFKIFSRSKSVKLSLQYKSWQKVGFVLGCGCLTKKRLFRWVADGSACPSSNSNPVISLNTLRAVVIWDTLAIFWSFLIIKSLEGLLKEGFSNQRPPIQNSVFYFKKILDYK